MSEPLADVLVYSDALACVDALACLEGISRDGLRPLDAQRRLREVQARYRHIDLTLVWDGQPEDDSRLYEALLRFPEGMTLSLRVGRDAALPAPSGGQPRSSDAGLVEVDGQVVTVRDAIHLFEVGSVGGAMSQRVVDAGLIREALRAQPVEVSEAEVRDGMAAWCRAHRLGSPEDVRRWVAERGMTHDGLERLVMEDLAIGKLRERIAGGRVESYLERNREALATLRIARIACADEAMARRMYALGSAQVDFVAAALHGFLVEGAPHSLSLAVLRRRALIDELGAAFASAEPGDTLGPVSVGRDYVVARVLSSIPASLDAATRGTIEQILFDDWLAERRRSATVTWCSGRPSTLRRPRE